MEDRKDVSISDIGHVGPGTPAGNWLRSYWLALWRSEDLTDIPQAVKILGERAGAFS